MSRHSNNLVKVADEQIRHLALRSEELSQETRVSVYLFNNMVQCLIFDMDVMRLPSIADLYSAMGQTALVDATLKSQEDLATTSQIYGDHAFLTFVLTDGQENASRTSWSILSNRLARAEENWSIGFLVPDSQGVAYMRRIGVYAGSVAVWDKDTTFGLTEAVSKIKSATDNFMTARVTGVRGTRSVFSTGVDAVNPVTVSKTLDPLNPSAYSILTVFGTDRIDNFVAANKGRYVRGRAYYQLTKTETIQPQKDLVVLDKRDNKVYAGTQARHLVGLPDGQSARVRPDANPYYEVFVQSTSINRKLLPGTRLLVLN
jgi:hypothetical protein